MFVLLQGVKMQKNLKTKKSHYWSILARNYSGPLTHVALSAVSAWLIVTGLKGLAGFAVNSQTVLADLLGIFTVIGIIRWMKTRSDRK